MKKIIYVITKGNWGGAQRYVFDCACHFKNEYDVSVILGEGTILEEKLSAEHIPTIKIATLGRDVRFLNDFSALLTLRKIFKNERPDIVHLNSSKIGLFGTLIGRLTRIPKIIFTIHGLPHNEERPLWQKGILLISSYVSILFSHTTILICKKDFDEVVHWPFLKKKITLIHNGISDNVFLEKNVAQEKISAIKKIPWGDNFILGTISELTKNKGLQYTLRAIVDVPKSVLVIIGEGEERVFLESEIKRLGLEERVFLCGFVKNAQNYLKAFDVFILSSIKEGLPYVLLEAGNASLPVIASNVGGIPDIVENQKTGLLFSPKETHALQKKIETLLYDKNLRENFAENLREKIRTHFSLRTMCEITGKIYSR